MPDLHAHAQELQYPFGRGLEKSENKCKRKEKQHNDCFG